jgi:hypothetical protein
MRRIDDPALSRPARRILLASLAMYADRFGYADQSAEENLAMVIDWYERGLLEIVNDGDGRLITQSPYHDGTAPVDCGDLHLDD